MAKISFNPKLYVAPQAPAPVAEAPAAPSIVYVDRIVEKRVEIPVPGPAIEVIKEVAVPGPIQVVEKEVIKYVDRAVEVIKEVPVEIVKDAEPVIKYVDRAIEIIKEIPVEVIKIEEKAIEKFVHVTPKWIVGLLASETVLLAIVLIHKLLS